MLVLGVVQMVARGIKGRRLWGKFGCGERGFIHAIGGRSHPSGWGRGRQGGVQLAEDVERAEGVCWSRFKQETVRRVRRNRKARQGDGDGEMVMEGKQEGREDGTGRGRGDPGYNDGVYIHVRRRRTPTRSREMTEFATARSTLPDSEPPLCRGSVSARPRPSLRHRRRTAAHRPLRPCA